MEKLIIRGGKRLMGTVKTSGAKNAVLPIIAASILGKTPSHLDEIPAGRRAPYISHTQLEGMVRRSGTIGATRDHWMWNGCKPFDNR